MSRAILDTSVLVAPVGRVAGESAISAASIAQLKFGVLIAAHPAGPDYLAEIQKPAELRDAGVLSEAEFTAKKSQILGLNQVGIR